MKRPSTSKASSNVRMTRNLTLRPKGAKAIKGGMTGSGDIIPCIKTKTIIPCVRPLKIDNP